MSPQTVEGRVQRLEQRMTSLEELPSRMDRVELQIVQLRTEMHDEFSAVRQELRSLDTGLREDIRLLDTGMRSLETGLRAEILSLDTGLRSLETGMRSLETGLREAIGDARRENRVLFEEYVGRLAVIDDGKTANARKRKQKKKKDA